MLKQSIVPLLAVTSLLGTTSLATTGELPSQEEMWQIVQQQQQEINSLKQQLNSQKGGAAPQTQAAAAPTESSNQKSGLHWAERITVSGEVAVKTHKAKNFAQTTTSDIALDTAQLNIDAKVTDMVSTHIALLHEEADNALAGGKTVDVDEATITLGNTEQFPVTLTAGRMYVPFGNFTSNLINDSLPLQLAETGETALQLSFLSNGFYGSVYTFNGDARKAGTNDTIDQIGGNLGYAGTIDAFTLDVGASLTNSMEDSDGITTAATAATVSTMLEHIQGAGVHAVLGYETFTLIGEYITAMDRFTNAELAWNGQGAKPEAWNLELGYGFDIMGKPTTASVAWQGTDEALTMGLPENRLMAGLSTEIFDKTSLAVEWMHDKDYNTSQTGNAAFPFGTNKTANTGSVKLTVGF